MMLDSFRMHERMFSDHATIAEPNPLTEYEKKIKQRQSGPSVKKRQLLRNKRK